MSVNPATLMPTETSILSEVAVSVDTLTSMLAEVAVSVVPGVKTMGYCSLTISDDFLRTLGGALDSAVKHYGVDEILRGVEQRHLRDGTKKKASETAVGETGVEDSRLVSPTFHVTIVGPKEWNKQLKDKDKRAIFVERLRLIIAKMPIIFSGVGTITHKTQSKERGENDCWTLYACVDRETLFVKEIQNLRNEFGLTELWYPHATLAFNVNDLHVDADGVKLNKSLMSWPASLKISETQTDELVTIYQGIFIPSE